MHGWVIFMAMAKFRAECVSKIRVLEKFLKDQENGNKVKTKELMQMCIIVESSLLEL